MRVSVTAPGAAAASGSWRGVVGMAKGWRSGRRTTAGSVPSTQSSFPRRREPRVVPAVSCTSPRGKAAGLRFAGTTTAMRVIANQRRYNVVAPGIGAVVNGVATGIVAHPRALVYHNSRALVSITAMGQRGYPVWGIAAAAGGRWPASRILELRLHRHGASPIIVADRRSGTPCPATRRRGRPKSADGGSR